MTFDFDLSKLKLPNAPEILSKIRNSNQQHDFTKLGEVLQQIFKMDLASNFYAKLRNVFSKLSADYLIDVKAKLSALIFKKDEVSLNLGGLEIVSMQDECKLDALLLLVYENALNQLRLFIDNVERATILELENFQKSEASALGQSDEINTKDNKKAEVVKNNYIDEFKEIKVIVDIEINKSFASLISKNLSNAVSHSNLDLFFDHYVLIRGIVKNNDNLLGSIFTKVQSGYIDQYFETREKKILESLDCEDWSALQQVPAHYQSILNFMENNGIQAMRQIEVEKAIPMLEACEHVSSEGELKATIELNKNGYKVMLTMLELINLIFDSYKMLIIMETLLSSKIVSWIAKILKSFVDSNYLIVLEGEGVKKGRLKSVSQKEISVTSANALIIRNLFYILINGIQQEDNRANELLTSLNNIESSCEAKMSDLFQQRYIE